MISRRKAIEATAALSYAAARGSAANSAVTIGIIGVGNRGSYDAGMLQKYAEARVAAICDIVPEKMEKLAARLNLEGVKTFSDYRALLTSDVDAVLIATPVFLHPEHFEAAVKTGKHVYCEKPAGADVAGCRRVMAAAKAARPTQNIAFGFQQRYSPPCRKAHQIVASGGIGKLRMAFSYWLKGAIPTGAPAPKPASGSELLKQWNIWRETFGDYVVETYCHGIDVLNWFCDGPPRSAIGAGARTAIEVGDQRDHTTVTFHYANGVEATLIGTQAAPAHYRDVRELFIGSDSVIETGRQYFKHFRGPNDLVEERVPLDVTADALKEFVQRVRESRPENVAIRAAESTLTAILARTAMDRRRDVTWDELMGEA